MGQPGKRRRLDTRRGWLRHHCAPRAVQVFGPSVFPPIRRVQVAGRRRHRSGHRQPFARAIHPIRPRCAAGTLMVEPTESEGLAELDRFIEAMIAIRAEIADIEAGRSDRQDNPLKNAPHTAEMLLAEEWHHAYPRQQAAYPVPGLRQAKYWPPVARVD